MRKSRLALALPVSLLIAACAPSGAPAPETPATEDKRPPAPSIGAYVELRPTAGNETTGSITFTVVDGHVQATGQVKHLVAGQEHGFHLHAIGDCSAPDGTSAGGHFNPGSSDHGRVGHGAHHGGDSDNLVADDNGVAQVDRRFMGVTIGDGSATDIIGRGVIVHANPDDYVTQPTGNAGERLACGVIEAAH